MKKQVKSIIFILVYSFILLELGLFLSGKFLLQQRRETTGKQTDVQFVCIGDSHTFGVGTSAPYAYPKQLEKLLNSNNPGQKFSVLNLGVPGSSTRAQSMVLQSFSSEHRADVVLWLTGRNNSDEDAKLWGGKSLTYELPFFFANLRSVKFFKLLFGRLSGKNATLEIREPFEDSPAYDDYMNFYLETLRRLCETRGAKLILLSYYNSTAPIVKKFADKHHVLFFDFEDDFLSFLQRTGTAPPISPDGSHLNRLGYKFYSERLYEDMFLDQKRLGLRLAPLLRKINDADFYADPTEVEKCVRAQQERVEQSKGTWTYPFEQIQLGHIYSEIGRDDLAKQCFMEGLISSNYEDNNMLVSPIITWNLKRGQRKEALRLCDEILSHNPKNSIAKTHREMLSGNPA